jgi:hypothetical protein
MLAPNRSHHHPHPSGRSQHLRDRFPLGPKRQKQPADLRILGLTRKHPNDRLLHLVGRKVLARLSGLYEFLKHVRKVICGRLSRKAIGKVNYTGREPSIAKKYIRSI